MNRMNGREIFAQQSFGLQQGHGRAAILVDTSRHFCRLFGEVHMDFQIGLLRMVITLRK